MFTLSYKAWNKKYNKEVLAYVKFGVASKNCQNYGICEIKTVDNAQKYSLKKGQEALCRISVNSEKELKFSFLSESMLAENIQKYFGTGDFVVEEDIQLPNVVTDALGIIPFVIKEGVYSVIKEERFIDVIFLMTN